jgi:hypothetical protein
VSEYIDFVTEDIKMSDLKCIHGKKFSEHCIHCATDFANKQRELGLQRHLYGSS